MQNKRSKQLGQSLVETAITLPVVLLLVLGVTDIGRAFYYREAVTNSVRQALRVAVSSDQQTTANLACASKGTGATTLSTTIGSASGTIATIANEAGEESSTNGTAAGSAIAGATISVTFHCLNSLAVTNTTGNGNGPADTGSAAVSVSITYSQNVLTPLVWTVVGTHYPITFTSYGRSEY